MPRKCRLPWGLKTSSSGWSKPPQRWKLGLQEIFAKYPSVSPIDSVFLLIGRQALAGKTLPFSGPFPVHVALSGAHLVTSFSLAGIDELSESLDNAGLLSGGTDFWLAV